MAMENVTVSKPPAQTAERIAERLSPPPGEDLPPASDPVISVSGLRMSYGAVEAVSGIDLAVYPGGGGSALPRPRSGVVQGGSILAFRGWVSVDHVLIAVQSAHHPVEGDLDRVSSSRLGAVRLPGCRGQRGYLAAEVSWLGDDSGCRRSIRLTVGRHGAPALHS